MFENGHIPRYLHELLIYMLDCTITTTTKHKQNAIKKRQFCMQFLFFPCFSPILYKKGEKITIFETK